ncbi:hypothetical protein K438DRAFT_1997941 [Mycena galopus ATCC 62051]|nr:hypothetical protein K438DRAFT_1997941 [Mycena galopus ATCC 62051]
MSESPSDVGLGIPRPPSTADLYPNAYPYPIAMTAIGVLSRANSLSSPANGGKQHYVRWAEYCGHRYSRSLSSSDDMYLPSASGSNANGGHWRWEWERSEDAAGPAQHEREQRRDCGGVIQRICGIWHLPKRWTAAHLTPRALPRRVHGPLRAMSAGVRLCAWASTSPALRPAARALSQEVLASSSSMSLSSSSSVFDDEGPPFRRFGSTRRSCCTPNTPTRTTAPLASTAPCCIAVRHLELEPILLLQRRVVALCAKAQAVTGQAIARLSPSPTGRFRNGRMKGMMRSFESVSPERGCGGGGGSGFRSGEAKAKARDGEGDDDAMGGTVRPHAHGHVQAQGTRTSGNGNGRALPVRPDTDSASAYAYGYTKVRVDALDPEATVRLLPFSEDRAA